MEEVPTAQQAQSEIDRLNGAIAAVTRRMVGYKAVGWDYSKADMIQAARYAGRVQYLQTLVK